MAYEKKLKRSKDGKFIRYVGANQTDSGAISKTKFRLGFDQQEAEKRADLIIALWDANDFSYWLPAFLDAAKKIAAGKPPELPPMASDRIDRDSMAYLQQLQKITATTGTQWEAANESHKLDGIKVIKETIQENKHVLAVSLGMPANANVTGITLDSAIEKFLDHCRKQYSLPDNSISPTGKSVIDEIEAIRRFLPSAFDFQNGKKKPLQLLKLDLGQIGFAECQQIYDAIRKRPISERTGARIKPRTAGNMLKVLRRFFDWLDTSELDWHEPPKFRKLNRKIDAETGEEKYQVRVQKELSVIPNEHLAIINSYCLPIERTLLILALNTASGEGECGQLRLSFLNGSELKGIRFKTGNETRHHLWQETVDHLAREISRRPVIKNDHQIVFVTAKGIPLWHKTPKGNYSNGISSSWFRLMKRVRKDYPEMPNYSFNKLRKTAAQAILRHCSAESASMILAHKTISDDELLECYVQMPWDKLYEAQRKWGQEILPLLKVPEKKIKVSGNALTLKQIEQLKELIEQGKSKTEVGQIMGIARMTVLRNM